MKLSEGRYELERVPLARGGMGEVWLGRDTKLDREIAVKFLRFPDGFAEEELVRRFVRESRITARLEHPGVPAVYDVGTHDGRPFLVMQRVRGISVADLVAEQGPLPVGWAVAIAAQVCSVLAAAHAASLVHRDLKPANLMLEPDGAVKVLDFGLAVAPTLADFSRITYTNQPLGTPAYMAPEQVEANLSEPATDLYALGCTLHEMLAGSHVFNGPTSFSLMAQQVKDAPEPLRTLRPEVPHEVERLVLDLLEKKPQDRPVGAGVVYQRLLPFVTGLGPLPGALHPPGTLSPVRLYAGVLGKVFAERPETGPVAVPTGRPADPASTVPVDDLPTVGWHDVLQYADGGEPGMAELLDALAGRGVRPPVVGYELGEEGWAAELAWPDRKVAVLLPGDANDPETTQRGAAFAAAGWDARTPDRWTVDELAGRVAA